ncbi:MAG: hypothetical protein AMXMBFR64_59560 [Myxococcales bacterium]
MTDFDSWFRVATSGKSPHAWQRALAGEPGCRSRLIRIPTGNGKTLGVLGAWAYNRIAQQRSEWPRRLVWALPMRVLAEQTADEAAALFDQLGVLWDGTGDHRGRVGVHLVMGGADAGEWNLFPEEAAVLVGTQDMLLSRAMNRGFAAPRARWPMEFGLLSQDALWVLDEVQLMDVGLATSAQLQAYRDEDAARGLRPCKSWWMSATLQSVWLHTVDCAAQHPQWVQAPTMLSASDRETPENTTHKSLRVAMIAPDEAPELARLVLHEHAENDGGDHGRITLVICNTVERATATYVALRQDAGATELHLVHSRFRPAERERWRKDVLCRAACSKTTDRIIIATQVVEAGVDISATRLITELAPWPSLVQRFGRCARYGGSGQVTVVDRGTDERASRPYSSEELEAALQALQALTDVGLAALDAFEESLSASARDALYPYAASHLLRRSEFEELFDTTPDLTGADLDVSRFIRSGDERDVQVFWADLPPKTAPSPTRRPLRRELCAVPFLAARDWLCGKETSTKRAPRLRSAMSAWVWDFIDGEWVVATRASLLPGRIVCVAADSGGYDLGVGFAPTSAARVPPVAAPDTQNLTEAPAQDLADDSQDAEVLSVSQWKTITTHGAEAAEVAAVIARETCLPEELAKLLALAARWHDYGKSHPAFQSIIRSEKRPDRPDLAKAPNGEWVRPSGRYEVTKRDARPGFRHELASALALFAILERYAPTHSALLGGCADELEALGLSARKPLADTPSVIEREILACSAEQFDLLAYLVLSHHGKVRVALHAAPKDQDHRNHDGRGLPIRGVREGDELPGIVMGTDEAPLPPLTLSLSPASLGLSGRTGRSWRERTLGLVARHGPGALAYMEALIIAADRRASRLSTSDPQIEGQRR